MTTNFFSPLSLVLFWIQDPGWLKIRIRDLVQEIKRDIIHRRMNITSPRGPIPLLRIHAHLLSVITKVASRRSGIWDKHPGSATLV